MKSPAWRLLLCALLLAGFDAHAQIDPLPSWNDGPAKQAILEFVKVTTDQANPKFVPPEARIAAFDQDGTTWVEQPMYAQVVFALHQVRDGGGEGPEAEGRRALQDRAVRGPRGHREAD